MTSSDSKTSRRRFVAGLSFAGAAAATTWWVRREPTLEESIPIDGNDAGRRLLEKIPAIDVHSHPGRSFLANGVFENPVIQSMSYGSEAERIADMQQGNVTASLFSIVADVQVLGFTPQGGIAASRDFEPGEAYEDFGRQLDHFGSLAADGILSFALTAADVFDAHKARKSVAILSCEGGDFIEDQLERLESAYKAGLRSVCIMHYRPNEYGDIQTAAPLHGGLTSLGADIVREMNRLGMLIDAAHATFETTRDIVELTKAPIMLSHSHLVGDGVANPRLISSAHANLIAENNGIIGSWPAGVSSRTMSDFVDETFRLIDQVGIDHVAVGTDLDANYKPVLTDYAQFPQFATMLLERGLSDEEAGKVLGLNFLRVFDASSSAKSA